ncbi:MAG: HEAT repeat domain-containing protein [Ignavibacteria bacterium]
MKKTRWEVAKALSAINDVQVMPALAQALDDNDNDIVWQAAEALKRYNKTAWPAMLRILIKYGADSVIIIAAYSLLKRMKEKSK